MFNRLLKIASPIIILASINLSAAILDKEQADNADLSLLENETILFQSIGMGIALSFAQCEGVDLCSLNVEESEIETLINTLDERIDSLVLKQEETEDPVSFDKVLTAYINERESYTAYLDQLKSISSTLDDGLLEESFGEEEADFPVESARNEELLNFLNDLEAFEDDDLEDDEDLDDLPDLPELEEIDSTP